MKIKILVVLVLTVSLISMASLTLDWGRVYSLPGIQEIFDVKATEDGVYLFGYTNQKGFNEDVLVLKFDKEGNMKYENKLGGSYNDWANQGLITSDGDFLFVGTSGSYGSDYDIYISKIGNNKFSTNVDKLGSDKGTSVVELDDGYVVVGYGSDPETLNARGRMIKLDKQGQVVFEKWLPYFVPGSDTKPLSIEKTSDGNLIIAGTVVEYFENRTKFYLTKVTPNGEEIWTKVFAPRDYARGFDVKEVPGGYVAVGYEGSWATGWSDIYVVKVNPDGNILWEAFYGDVESDHGYSVAVGPNGKIYVAGYITTLSGDKDVAILEYDNNGKLLSSKTLGGHGDDVAYSIDIDSEGNLYVAGYSQSADLGADSQKDVFVLKYTVR
ncbi:hypothetical protein PW5551_08040 [Petrotoga sp. 9PW.55.5.1]|uniref:SBBP repeat-containing protein n=1 Tax=Petrotoga sp. 9PW.55.5.1 TaxID=1308979 RepID=UPI000DC36E86|nr:SBBP repeat-containing protein [Petrotoga sp. 9PW.55.5.1]RAO98732.1 hypothetical protein PW5551_08040 [Petrotoga sp. 9PW.55.5.1]